MSWPGRHTEHCYKRRSLAGAWRDRNCALVKAQALAAPTHAFSGSALHRARL
jgi:hypothetical protein